MAFEEIILKSINSGCTRETAVRLYKIDEVKNHINLNEYMNDDDETVRQYVAYQKYNLKLLASDKSSVVKRTVLDVISDMDKNSTEFLEIYNILKEDENYDIRLGLEKMGMAVKYLTNQHELKRKIYDRTLNSQMQCFQEIPKHKYDIHAVLFIDMNYEEMLNMAKNSKDFETLILLAENSDEDFDDIKIIAKERAEELGFYANVDRIEELIKNHFK